MTCLLLLSFDLSADSKRAFTLLLTLDLKVATSLTLTSDSSRADVISLRVASRTFAETA